MEAIALTRKITLVWFPTEDVATLIAIPRIRNFMSSSDPLLGALSCLSSQLEGQIGDTSSVRGLPGG